MYHFNIKDDSPNIDLVLTRCLLALAGIVSLLYHGNHPYGYNIVAATIILLIAATVDMLTNRFKLKSPVLLAIGAVVSFMALRSFTFSILVFLAGFLTKKIYTEPAVTISSEGIQLKKMSGSPVHAWSEFNNIILKDNLLTLDFKNNYLLQLAISPVENQVDEKLFNAFCTNRINQ